MMRYLIVIEQTETGVSAYSPDVPACVATGQSIAEAEANMRDAIGAHLEELRRDGVPAPKPTSVAASHVEVAA